MLTQEQIKNLKKGDTVLVEAEVSSPLEYGAVVTHGCITHALPAGKLYPHPSDSDRTFCHVVDNMIKPKHDPTRLFKKGDIVEMDTHGRDIAASMKKSGVELGERYTVTEDENNTGYVSFIGDDGIEHNSIFFWLKLVTPVEELEPYKLIDSPNTYNIVRDSAMVMTIHKKSHPNAKAAAEAERDRLNEEWRKEQK